jgi:hypothetical protein
MIAHASLMQILPSANTHVRVVMVAEKIAASVTEDDPAEA